jgi:hypothetical protein
MGGQLVNQVGNVLGSLAQSFPNAANSILFPNGATGNPTQDLFDAFGKQARNALATAAFEIGSSLALFNGFSRVVLQIQPMLFGSASGVNSLASALQNLPFGGSGFNSAVLDAFNSAFNNMVGPVNSFFGMQGQSSVALPLTGITSPFSTQFSGSSFMNGFNNGFAPGTNTGFVGFGPAPSIFNTNFGTAFNNSVASTTQSMGFIPLGTTGTAGGVPVQSR